MKNEENFMLVEKEIKNFLALNENIISDDIKRDTELIESRILDSLRFMDFILLLETLRNKPIDIENIEIDHFRTLNAIKKHLFS